MRIAFAALLFLGCGRIDFDPHEPTDEHSGTRLKRVLYDVGGTSFAATYFYDSLRDEDCIPARLSDGVVHCVPSQSINTVALYLDAACTMPAFDLSTAPCQQSAAYVIDIRIVGCGGDFSRVRPVGVSVAASELYSFNASGTCVQTGSTPTNVVSLGEEIAPAEFVALDNVLAPDPGRAQRRFWEAADGFRVQNPNVVYDTTFASDCGGSPNVDGGAWIPGPLEQQPGSEYSDPACTLGKAADFKQCHGLRFGGEFDACSNLSVHSITETAGDPIYFLSGQNCSLGAANPTATYYDWGPSIPLMPLTPQFATGTSRMGTLRYGADLVSLPARPYDRLLDAECSVRGDGKCVPQALSVATLFDDASCTVSRDLAVDATRTGCQRYAPVPLFAQRYLGSCDPNIPIYVRGAVHTAPAFMMSGTCMPYASMGFDLTAYELGAEITDLETATYVVEP